MYLFVNTISNEKNRGRAVKYEKEFVLGKRRGSIISSVGRIPES